MKKLDLPISDLDLPDGFEIPKLDDAFDPGAYIRATPEEATVKGMFLQAFSDYVEQAGKRLSTGERFYTFTDVPLRHALELAQEAAELVHPDLPLAEGLRQVGRVIYPTFASSMIGRVIFSAAGHHVGTIFNLAPKAVDACLSHGKLVAESTGSLDKNSTLLRISDTTIFTECVPLGMAEGVLAASGRHGIVARRIRSLTQIEMFVRWE